MSGAKDSEGEPRERVGWVVPDENDDAWGEALAALEDAGFSVSETRGGQMLSRRSFEINRRDGE